MFFDYKQIEPRLLAYYLNSIGDSSLVDELNKGTDTYSAIIAPLYNKAPADLTDEERQEGKTTYLSLSYGAGVWKLAKTLDVDMRTARDISDGFWRAWPGIKVLMAIINQRYEKRGYIKTLYGRHLHPESPHKALNALIQGCAADIMRHALIEVHRQLNGREGTPYFSHMVSVVHDEIIMDTFGPEISHLAKIVPSWMDCAIVSDVVPIYVDVEWSTSNWAEKAPYEGDNG